MPSRALPLIKPGTAVPEPVRMHSDGSQGGAGCAVQLDLHFLGLAADGSDRARPDRGRKGFDDRRHQTRADGVGPVNGERLRALAAGIGFHAASLATSGEDNTESNH